MTSKLPLDCSYDLEQQFILRMTDVAAAENLAADIDAGVSFKENFTIEFMPDMRRTVVRYNGQVYQGRIMDLPCIIESLKTTDRNSFYKTADICQMMICTQGEEDGPLRGTAAYLDNRAGSRVNSFDISRENREYQFLHGLTPPLKNVLRRRFRKTRRKRFVDMPKIEKEVKQLLRADLQADSVKWEVIWSDPPTHTLARPEDGDSADQSKDSSANTAKSTTESGMTAPVTADDEVEEDEEEEAEQGYRIDRRDVFGDISSSSSGGSSSERTSSLCGSDSELEDANPDGSNEVEDVFSVDSKRKQALESQPEVRPQSPIHHREDALKDQLAAELLLSESGEDSEDAFGPTHHEEDHESEDMFQASVAAQLVSDELVIDAAEDDIDVDDVDDDEVHRGGELLDDAALIGLSAPSMNDEEEFARIPDY